MVAKESKYLCLLGGVTRVDQSAAISMRTRNLGQPGITDAETVWRYMDISMDSLVRG